ncbi:MAG: hemolysin III family protein [Sideroxydans sp.]|nr:hemolysin III family protein [Sideroxydans sp.]
MNEATAADPSPERKQSHSEEVANSISHAIGLLAAIAGTPLLIAHALQHGDTGYLVGCSIFAATMILLYLASTLYHALYHSSLKRVFQVIDHAVIYLLIAGTYTPFTLGVLHGAWGWSMFGVIWGLAAIGIVLKVIYRMEHPYISTALYLAMGWLILVAVKPFYTSVPAAGLIWLLVGGLSYTVGVAFFVTDKHLRYGHFIWHWFVLGGTVSHYFAVWYAV